jgi:hypothetical protein
LFAKSVVHQHRLTHMSTEPSSTRREFLKSTAATTAAGVAAAEIVFPSILSAAPNSDKLRIGFIGCGGRGTGAAAQALKADSNVELWAVGDAFAGPIENSLKAVAANVKDDKKINVAPERKFVGLDAYEKVINSGVDLVILTSPPGYRPAHLRAAVEAENASAATAATTCSWRRRRVSTADSTRSMANEVYSRSPARLRLGHALSGWVARTGGVSPAQ